jgi:hypothetical protein
VYASNNINSSAKEGFAAGTSMCHRGEMHASDLGSKSMSIRVSLPFLLFLSSMIVLTAMALYPQARYQRAQESIYHKPEMGTFGNSLKTKVPDTRTAIFIDFSLRHFSISPGSLRGVSLSPSSISGIRPRIKLELPAAPLPVTS